MWQACALLVAAVAILLVSYYAPRLLRRREREMASGTTPLGDSHLRERAGVIRARRSAAVQTIGQRHDIADAEEWINRGLAGQACANSTREMSTQFPDVAEHDVRAKTKRVKSPSQRVCDENEHSPNGDGFRRARPTGRAVASSSHFVNSTAQHYGGRSSSPSSAVNQSFSGSPASVLRQKSRAHTKSTSSLLDRGVGPSTPDLQDTLLARKQRVDEVYDRIEDSTSGDDRFRRAPSARRAVASSGCSLSPADDMTQYHLGVRSSTQNYAAIEASRPAPSVLRQGRRVLERNTSTSSLPDQDFGLLTSDLTPSQARMLRQERRVQGVLDSSLSPAFYPSPTPLPPASEDEDGADPYQLFCHSNACAAFSFSPS